MKNKFPKTPWNAWQSRKKRF